jgi:hypothetical protein
MPSNTLQNWSKYALKYAFEPKICTSSCFVDPKYVIYNEKKTKIKKQADAKLRLADYFGHSMLGVTPFLF